MTETRQSARRARAPAGLRARLRPAACGLRGLRLRAWPPGHWPAAARTGSGSGSALRLGLTGPRQLPARRTHAKRSKALLVRFC
jgi:hypothetical protein